VVVDVADVDVAAQPASPIIANVTTEAVIHPLLLIFMISGCAATP
jgi:hypothetical protein